MTTRDSDEKTARPARAVVRARLRAALRTGSVAGLRARFGAVERGAATAEYAIVIMAAVGFAGLLVVIMRSDAVRAMLTDLVQRALTFAG